MFCPSAGYGLKRTLLSEGHSYAVIRMDEQICFRIICVLFLIILELMTIYFSLVSKICCHRLDSIIIIIRNQTNVGCNGSVFVYVLLALTVSDCRPVCLCIINTDSF